MDDIIFLEKLIEKMKQEKSYDINQFIKLLKYTNSGRKYLREQKLKRIIE